ncbi:LysR family transcriptional regulator [Celeribacter arenosi]|uniref:LysR family transcriptional regulator n=1 Tax=Celeribacter arenosi TaxID=792649 RepID=A0ABP7KD73_9RHOB
MEDNPKLDDFLLFLAVADGGGLSGAVKSTGTPAPTLSRRMAELERRLGKRLFERGKRGYSLTADGRALVVQAEPLRAAARRLSAFNAVQTRPRVRITAGHWTSQFISKRMGTVWTPDAIWIPELVASNAMVDIARREADIGIRKRRPDQPWLAGRRTGTITYAEFATSEVVQGYITLPETAASAPSQRWLRDAKPDEIVTTASDTRAEADLALGGIGRVVLPVFVGKSLDGLVQVSPVIDELTHDEWLVSHHDARHDPPVRAALEAVATILMART